MQTVLAIDDSEDIHNLLKVRLASEGIRLEHAYSAEEGLRRAREEQPDLVLLDVDMPDMSGFEVCRRLKEDPVTAATPIIFLSVASAVYSKVAGFDLGAVDYVTKPFDTAELRARVRAALRMKRYYDLLAQKAQVDALTGLWNRGYFNQRFGEEVAAAQRYGRSLSLVLLDLDHFKRINDSQGHPFGDRVLQAVGEMLASTMRTTDAPCRFGGEEFALILSETSIEDARLVTDRVRKAVAELELTSGSNPISVTVSIGLTSTTNMQAADISVQSLLARADEAHYEAKNAGRNCVKER